MVTFMEFHDPLWSFKKKSMMHFMEFQEKSTIPVMEFQEIVYDNFYEVSRKSL